MNDNKKAFKMFLIPILCGFAVIVAAIFAKNITVQKSMSATNCELGQYYNGTSCTSCPTGYGNTDGYDATSATQCYANVQAGFYIPNPMASVQACAAGTIQPNQQKIYYGQSNSCSVCEAGTYEFNGVECKTCPNGTVSPIGSSGSSSCTAPATVSCTQGKYIPAGSSTCSKTCEAGFYCPGGDFTPSATANVGRYNCPTGYTSNIGVFLEGSCYITCEPGEYKATQSTTACGKCAAGTYSQGGNGYYGQTTSCTACTGNTYTSSTGQSSCSTCSTGYTVNNTNTGCNANTYTIVYNKNNSSATGTTANSTHTYGQSKSLTANGYSLTGYTFSSWNTKANGTGTSYTNKQSVTNLTTTNGATITLYAQWTSSTIPVIRIRFASESDHIQMRVGQEYPLYYNITPSNATNQSVTFSTDDLVKAKSPGVATISIRSNDTSCTDTDDCSDSVAIEVLEASSESSSSSTTGPSTPTTVEYTLTYNVNGGNACSPTTKTVTSGSKWGTLCTPTRSGYKFKEWNTKKNGSGTKVTSSSIASSNMTVYAQWTSSGSSTVSVTGIVLKPTTWTMKVNDTKELEATITPTNATNKNVVWTSNNTSVATVNSNGVVTGISPGTATITVTTVDGNKTATSKITVVADSEEPPINENEYVIITEVYYGNITDSAVVTEGSDKTIEYSPYEGYELSKILIDGEEVSTEGIETQYTFENVTEDHYITVIYGSEIESPKTGLFEVGGVLLIVLSIGGVAYYITKKKQIANI